MRAFREKMQEYTYYFIIGITSLLALVFLPMLGTEIGLGWDIPNTTIGWIVWAVVKVIVAGINVLIFHSFMQQAKVNIKDDPKYKEANEILGRIKTKEYRPRSPKKFNADAYGKKGATIFATSALTTIAITQALLKYDVLTMLTYLFTIIMGLIFGIMQMFKAQDYWTREYYDYAKEKEQCYNSMEKH